MTLKKSDFVTNWKTNVAALVYLGFALFDLINVKALNANSILLLTSAWAFINSKDA